MRDEGERIGGASGSRGFAGGGEGHCIEGSLKGL